MRQRHWTIWAALLGFVAFVVLGISGGRTAFEMGGDEHFEVMKALLWARNVSLYSPVWNDQPPLYTALLGLAFECCDARIEVARAVALAFGCSLLAACGVVVGRRQGALAAVFAMTGLLLAPEVFGLSVSAMLEVPAIGTALWALWPILRWQERVVEARVPTNVGSLICHGDNRTVATGFEQAGKGTNVLSWAWLAVSSGLFAVALQIKLTAAVVAPALVVEILFGTRRSSRRTSEEGSASERRLAIAPLTVALRWLGQRSMTPSGAVGIWVASAVTVYLALIALLGTVPLDVLWASHFSPQMLAHAGIAARLPFWPVLWGDHREALWAAGAGLLVLAWRRAWRRVAFPVVLLLTVAFIHIFHRPWWSYYYLHLAVPLAWLGGCGIAELFRMAWVKAGERSLGSGILAYGYVVAASLLLALVITNGGYRLAAEIDRLRHLPRVAGSMIVAEMRKYANHTQWVYTRHTMYAFHAGLVVVPELAVLPQKRFWSGQITEEQIWATVRRYRPEQLLFPAGELAAGIRPFVAANYTEVCESEGFVLYVAKRLFNHAP